MTLEQIQEQSERLRVWMCADPVRLMAIEDCAQAGNRAVGDSTVPFEEPFKTVDVACAAQIISGWYDNAKVAQSVFVDAVLLEMRKYPVELWLGR